METTTRAVLASQPLSHAIGGARERLQAIAAERREIEAARTRGRGQIAELGERRRRIRESGADANAAADAMLAGETVTADLADPEVFSRQQDALRAGLSALDRRDDALAKERGDVEQTLRAVAAERMSHSVDRLRKQAAAALKELADAYAGAAAIRHATGSNGAADLAIALEPVLARVHTSRLIATTPIAVPSSVGAALNGVRDAVELGGRQIPTAVQFPLARSL